MYRKGVFVFWSKNGEVCLLRMIARLKVEKEPTMVYN